MLNKNRITCLYTILCLALAFVTQAASASISSYGNAPTPVRHALHRLSAFTGIPEEMAAGKGPSIRVELNTSANANIGPQGYTIRSARNGDIEIRGNEAEGAANGVYTFLRILMIEHRKDPFSRKWEIQEKPQFAIRQMLIAPYRYGGSYGFAALSPDRWSLEEWKEYVDFARLCNITVLTMASTRMYDPAYPHSEREKWRYEVWKQVMDYCHQVGMKFNWFMFPNQVVEQAFWDNPDKRTVEPNAWWGNALIWSKGKDLILKDQKYTMEYFRGLDALELIPNDGGAHFDESDPVAVFADQVRSYQTMLREAGNDADIVFWNWYMDLWTTPQILQKYPKYKTLQDDVIPQLPKNIGWLDASVLTLIEKFGHWVRAAGNPPFREGVLVGKEAGFRPVIDFFWYMNPELAVNMFPHPSIRRAIQEAQYARDELGVDGVGGYRLAPPCRFIDDYVYFRVASDPSLTQEQLVKEVAGLLAEKPENQTKLEEAINTLEQFWTSHKLEDIEKAEKSFRALLPEEKSKNLQYVSNGVTFLTYIVRMAQPGVTAMQKSALKQDLYRVLKPMYIFQGPTADIVWQPEAIRFFNARVDMMVEDYKDPLIAGSPYPEVVDRSIYPKATSKPYTLQWPKRGEGAKP